VHSLGGRLDIDEFEHERLAAVKPFAYSMTPFHPQRDFELPRPVVCVVPFRFEERSESRRPRPRAVVRLWADRKSMLQWPYSGYVTVRSGEALVDKHFPGLV